MHKLTNFTDKRKQLVFTITSLSILVLMLTSTAAASVDNWEFSPQEPVCGDTINIKGSASPGEKVDIYVTFEKTVPVSEGKFEYILEDVKIPEGLNNLFTVEARGARDLNVRVKMLIWVTKSSGASGDTAVVSQSNVPPGNYRIKIDGNANEGVSEINLKITACQGLEADSKGAFSYSYSTKAVPAGDFEIKTGSIIKKVTIQPEKISDSNSDSSSSKGSSSGNSSPNNSSSGNSSLNSSSSGNSSPNSSSSGDSSPSSSSSGKTKFSPLVKNESSSLSENEPSSESVVSETQEEKKDSMVLASDKNTEERKIQAQPSEKSALRSEFFRLFVDKTYLVIGVGAAIMILIIYLKKK